MLTITESGMSFGPYPEESCFYIEQSQTYQGIQNGLKIAEFLLVKPSQKGLTIWIIEAKSSSPQPGNLQKFDPFIEEIRAKLTNTLVLYVATYLKRHATWDELPQPFQSLSLDQVEFRLILVVKGHQEQWLPPLQDALKKALKPTISLWNLSPNSVVVLNETGARKRGLISSEMV